MRQHLESDNIDAENTDGKTDLRSLHARMIANPRVTARLSASISADPQRTSRTAQPSQPQAMAREKGHAKPPPPKTAKLALAHASCDVTHSLKQRGPDLARPKSNPESVQTLTEPKSSYAKYRAAIVFIAALGASSAGAQQVERAAPAIVRANAEAVFSSSLAARVELLPFESGQQFQKGDVLVQLDCAVQKAQADAASADHKAAIAEFDSAKALLERGGTSRVRVAVLEAQAAATKARENVAQAVLKGCVIQAPFNGRVVDTEVNEFEYIGIGEPILSIVSTTRPFLEISAPSNWLNFVEIGSMGRFTSTEQSLSLNAIVSSVGATVDPVSGTIVLKARFDDPGISVLPGTSGVFVINDESK
jgi:acetyl/propionyl-CoA carboxylase alpha subunit